MGRYRKCAALVAVFAAWLMAMVVAGPPAFAATVKNTDATGEIIGIDGLCMDVTWGNSGDGTAVQSHVCDGNNAQKWVVRENGTITTALNNTKCLDIKDGSTAAGAVLQIWACNGQPNQQWTPGSYVTLRNPTSGRCVEVPGGTTNTQLTIADCPSLNQGKDNQVWELPHTGPVASVPASGRCMDVDGGWASDRQKVQIWTCNGSDAQQWTLDNGTISYKDKCLDIKDAGTTEGTLLQLFTCNGGTNQAWVRIGTTSLRNPVSGLCVRLPANWTDGTQLDIGPCGLQNTDWRSPSAIATP